MCECVCVFVCLCVCLCVCVCVCVCVSVISCEFAYYWGDIVTPRFMFTHFQQWNDTDWVTVEHLIRIGLQLNI